MQRCLARMMLTVFLVLGATAPAAALVPPPIDIVPPFATAKLQRDLLDRREERKTVRRPAPRLDSGPLSSASVTIASTYRYDAARTQQNLATFIARSPNAAAKANL